MEGCVICVLLNLLFVRCEVEETICLLDAPMKEHI